MLIGQNANRLRTLQRAARVRALWATWPEEYRWKKWYIVDGQHRHAAYLRFNLDRPDDEDGYVTPSVIAMPASTPVAYLVVIGQEANALDANGYIRDSECDRWMLVSLKRTLCKKLVGNS